MHTKRRLLLAGAAIAWLAASAHAQTQQGTQPMNPPAHGTAIQPGHGAAGQPAYGTGSEPAAPSMPPAPIAPHAATGALPGAGSQAVLIASESLIGAKVRDPQGQDLGAVKQLMVEPEQGKIQYAVVAVGGVLGMNQKEVAVPWSSLKLARDEGEVIVTAERQVLDQAPPTQAELDERLQEQRDAVEDRLEDQREGAEESDATE